MGVELAKGRETGQGEEWQGSQVQGKGASGGRGKLLFGVLRYKKKGRGYLNWKSR